MRPLIGIPLCLDDRGRWREGREYHYLDAAYARAVERAGGAPVYLPIQADPQVRIRELDGLLVPGGDDLPPPRPYPADVAFDPAPAAQLDFDRRLLGAALDRGIPVLAICYGMQLLALHRGGSLHYDIATDVPGAGNHRLREDDGRHAVRLEPGTRLASALGRNAAPVNSLHHQAVSDPGAGLRVSARAEDGLIEAIECEGSRFVIGVQWHPEKLPGPLCDDLFGAFVSASAQRVVRP